MSGPQPQQRVSGPVETEPRALYWRWQRAVIGAGLGKRDLLVALVLLSHATMAGASIYPGEELLAVECGMDRKTVRSATASLHEAGWIELVSEANRAAGRARSWRLALPLVWGAVPHKSNPPEQSGVGKIEPGMGKNEPGMGRSSPSTSPVSTGSLTTGSDGDHPVIGQGWDEELVNARDEIRPRAEAPPSLELIGGKELVVCPHFDSHDLYELRRDYMLRGIDYPEDEPSEPSPPPPVRRGLTRRGQQD